MTVGAGDNDFSDYGQGCFQITPKLVAAGDVVEIYKRFLAEKNLLHVGKTGELCNTKCIFTGDAIGSGYIVLLICSEEHAMETVEQYRESLMKITPRMSELKNFAWLGGHGIQENGCDPRHQQDYLAGESQYFNPIRQQVMLDMICLCNNLISGKISWKSVMDSPEHYCNTGSAGIFFRFI